MSPDNTLQVIANVIAIAIVIAFRYLDNGRRKKLQTQVADANTAAVKASTAADDNAASIRTLTAENKALGFKVDALEAENASHKAENERINAELKDKSAALDTANEEIKALGAKVIVLEDALKRMTTERASVDTELQAERTKSAQLETDLQAARRRITELEIKVIRLEERLNARQEAQADIVQPLLDGFANLLRNAAVGAQPGAQVSTSAPPPDSASAGVSGATEGKAA